MHMHDRINALRTAIDTGAIIPCRVNMLLELDRLIASVPAKARGVQRQTGKLTIASIKAIKAKGRYSDGHGMSLNVRERKGGLLTFTFEQVLRLEAGGRFTTISIGKFPDIDLDTARIPMPSEPRSAGAQSPATVWTNTAAGVGTGDRNERKLGCHHIPHGGLIRPCAK